MGGPRPQRKNNSYHGRAHIHAFRRHSDNPLISTCSDMPHDVGQNMVQLSCFECCVMLREFAHRSEFLCVSRSGANDAHRFFVECFSGCHQSMRTRRVTATRQLQHNTSQRKFFVLGAPVPFMLLATWWVRPPVDDGRCEANPTTEVKERTYWSRSVAHSCSGHTCYRASHVLYYSRATTVPLSVVFSCACLNNMWARVTSLGFVDFGAN